MIIEGSSADGAQTGCVGYRTTLYRAIVVIGRGLMRRGSPADTLEFATKHKIPYRPCWEPSLTDSAGRMNGSSSDAIL
jgi:hypothetical protein